jgi:hypothetical protein
MSANAIRIPDVVGEVTGWRAWQIDWCGRVPRLFSINAAGRVGLDDAMWPADRWIEAKCPSGHTAEEIPVESCSCGLYAAKTPEQLQGLAYGSYGSYGTWTGDKLAGEVGFAGKVIEGSQGWRAQKGRIVQLWVPLSKWQWVELLEQHYRVPVNVMDWRPFERG